MKSIILLGFIFFVSSCSHLKIRDKLPNDYVILYDKELNGSSLALSVGEGSFIKLIPERIMEAGNNDSFIIAKQGIYDNSQKRITEIRYYIIPLVNKASEFLDENKIGPLTKKEFDIKRKELKIPDNLVFTTKY